jgi:enoyl-CoA hydratase
MSDPTTGTVDLHIDGHLATVTLNRPEKLNALTPEMLDALERAVMAIDAHASVRVAIIASAGDRAFCAGADIKRFSLLDGTQMWAQWTRRGHQVFDRVASLRQPTIAAIDGNAFGGGLELALACDLRILAEDATLGLTEVGLGTVPGWGGTQRLPHQIGVTRAKELVLTGAPITASTALAWGLVNQTVPASQVREKSRELAAALATKAPVAVQMAKQAIDIAQGASPGMPLEGIAAAAAAAVADFAEGLSAYTQRRQPSFTGLATTTNHTQEGH